MRTTTAVEFSRGLNEGDLSKILQRLERFAAESPRPPHALPLPAWGFRGAPKKPEEMLEIMTTLMNEQAP